MQIPFLGGAYEGRSTNVASQQAINYFFERNTDSEALVSTPGSSLFNSTYSGEVRGGIEYRGNAFFVIGNQFIEFTAGGVGTVRGTINTSSGIVSLAAGLGDASSTATNKEVFIADGSTGYIFDAVTNTVAEVSDPDMVATDVVTFFDSRFAFNEKGTEGFVITDIYDGNVLNAISYATGDPDAVVSLVAEQRQIFALGEKTTSAWYSTGDNDEPIARYQGGYTQTGCAATHSAQRFDNSVIWLSRNERGHAQVVRSGEGFQPTIVSPPEVNYQFSTYSTVSDAFAYVYQFEGHEFYVLTFPTAKKTWVYDAATQQWHQRGHNINGQLSRERYNCHVFAFGKHLFGDYANGKIYEMDPDLGTIDGDRIPRIRVSGNISFEEKEFRISSLQLDMEEGTGDPNSATDTSIWLSYSKDGGHTFSNEVEKSIGDAGEYAHRVMWRRLGSARNWIFKVRTWSPNKVIIKGLIARQYGEP